MKVSDQVINLILEHPELVSKEQLEAIVNQYKKPLYAGLSVMFDFYKDLVNNQELYEYQALNKKNAYDAYVKVGFSEEQAFALVLRDNLQLLKNMQDNMNKANTNKVS